MGEEHAAAQLRRLPRMGIAMSRIFPNHPTEVEATLNMATSDECGNGLHHWRAVPTRDGRAYVAHMAARCEKCQKYGILELKICRTHRFEAES